MAKDSPPNENVTPEKQNTIRIKTARMHSRNVRRCLYRR